MGLMSLLYQVFPSMIPSGEEGTLWLCVDVCKYRHSSCWGGRRPRGALACQGRASCGRGGPFSLLDFLEHRNQHSTFSVQ